jgi:hypothetical protein
MIIIEYLKSFWDIQTLITPDSVGHRNPILAKKAMTVFDGEEREVP